MKEPIHDLSSRDTSVSQSEGRLKQDVYSRKSKKKNLAIKKILKNKKYGYSK